MTPDTHPRISRRLCGEPVQLEEGGATVDLVTLPEMAADDLGLVHGGFVFGAADYAAMLAVNHPNVVLGSADTRFVAPVRAGETVRCAARRTETKGRKHVIEVVGAVGEREVFRGTFTAFVLDRPVLAP